MINRKLSLLDLAGAPGPVSPDYNFSQLPKKTSLYRHVKVQHQKYSPKTYYHY